MNAEDRKRLKEINNTPGSGHPARCTCIWCVDRLWLISRLEAEAQENERYRKYWVQATDQCAAADKRIEIAEATCQSLLDQSSRWEAQALEAGAKIRDLIGRNDINVHEGMAWHDKAKVAEGRCAELEAAFSLQQTRMAEATRAWQKTTGKRDVLPDLGDLLAWLMDRLAVLKADNRRLREADEACIEKLAAYAHEAWSGWMKYQEKMGGNDFWRSLPVELAERWIRQANTDYENLPKEEKKSDRVEARRMLAIMEPYISARLLETKSEEER